MKIENNNQKLIIISIFFTFVLIFLLIAKPFMFLNDEWITGNQVHQLDIGHQILIAEGKYGYEENKTPKQYFMVKDEVLQYTTYVPIISRPTLLIIKLFGNDFPFLISILWSLLLIINSLLIRKIYISQKRMVFFSRFLVISAMVFFFLNLYFYKPINFNIENSPYEILGVGLFHILVLFLLVIVFFLISECLFNDFPYKIFSTISCIYCSSYLFWSTTLKDHIDSVFFISLIILLLIYYLKKDDIWFFYSAFIASGLLTWVRPEYGSIIIILLFLIFIIVLLKHISTTKKYNIMCTVVIPPFFSIIGLIPLLVGNFLTTGNPILLAWQFNSKIHQMGEKLVNMSGIPVSTTPVTIIQTIIQRITPQTDSLGLDIYSILIAPTTLKMPLLSLTPLFLLGIIIIPLIYLYTNKEVTKKEWRIIGLLLVFVIATFLAYATSITGLGASVGIYPDVRYLCPAYLPLNLIGLILLQKIIEKETIVKAIKFSTLITFFCIPFIVVLLTYFHSIINFWDFFLYLNGIFPILIYSLLGIAFVTIGIKIVKNRNNEFDIIPLSFLLALPLLWQICLILIANFYLNTFTSYPPLLPVMRILFEHLTGYIP